MAKTKIETEYFEWLCHKICDRNHTFLNYSKLLRFLHNKEFNYIIAMDGNRAEDGIDLRYRFSHEKNYDCRIAA